MSAEEEKDVTGEDGAEKPAAKKARAKKPRKAAKAAETKAAGKDVEAKDGAGDAAEASKPAAKKAAKKPAAKKAPAAKEPVAAEKKASGKAPAKPRRRVVRAHARYVRTSARKARMVCGHLRGKSVQEARAILAFTPREVARDWSKLLESAVANAESNHELLEDDLIVREAYADEGPTIKRFRPRAMGRATPIRKRTSHLTIALSADANIKKN
jgi:ribosomal protein L22